jgi:ABC-type Mn2+/Zn2+ transport system ATPase subunit
MKKNTFGAFFFLELKRFLSKKNMVVFLLFLLFCLYLVSTGVQQYNEMLEGKYEFRRMERKKVEQIVNYDQYGLYGFRLYFMPCTLSTLFYNSSHFTELTCRIDSGEKLNIYVLFKGKKIFTEKPGKSFDFSGIILLLGSLIALYHGYDSFRSREYIKSLSSLYGYRRTFFSIWLSRAILLCISFILVTSVVVFYLVINISITRWTYLLVFLLVMLIMQLFFFTVGTIASSSKSRLKDLLILLFWILSVYFFPAVLNKIVEARAEKIISYYQSELNKLKVLMPFEKEGKEEIDKVRRKYNLLAALLKEINLQKINNPGSVRKWIDNQKARKTISTEELEILGELIYRLNRQGDNLTLAKIAQQLQEMYDELMKIRDQIHPTRAQHYLGKKFPQIQKVENDLKTSMKSNIDYFHFLSSIFPTAFYLSTGNEISSRGYINIINFYDSTIKIKHEFLKFYVGHKYGKEPDKIINFIEEVKEKKQGIDEANIFKGTCYLPGNFRLGILISLFWFLLFFVLSYKQYKSSLFLPPKEKIQEISDLEIDLNKGASNVVLCSGKMTMSDHLYNTLSGENKEFTGKVTMDGKEVGKEETGTDFVYLCQPDRIPGDIKARDFFSFMVRSLKPSAEQEKHLYDEMGLKECGNKEFNKLQDEEKGRIFFNAVLLKKSNIYMFHDFVKGMPSNFIKEFKDQLEKLKEEGTSILYITNDVFLGGKLGDYVTFLKKDAELMRIRL